MSALFSLGRLTVVLFWKGLLLRWLANYMARRRMLLFPGQFQRILWIFNRHVLMLSGCFTSQNSIHSDVHFQNRVIRSHELTLMPNI